MGLIRLNMKCAPLNIHIINFQVCQLTNTDSCLQENFDNGGNALVGPACVSKRSVFEFDQHMRASEFILWMRDRCRWIVRNHSGGAKEAEKRMDEVKLAVNALS